MQGIAFSWLYMVGLDCARRSFFTAGSVNDWVGTLALAPLLRPLRVLRDKGSESRALVYLLLNSLFGVSLSHLVVDVFLAVAVPIMWYKLGMWGICKYWLLPLVFAHINAGNFLEPLPASSFLFPQLKPMRKNMPFYSLEAVASHTDAAAGPFTGNSWFWSVTREVLLWRKRDILLHVFLVVGGLLALLNPAWRNWASVPILLLLPFLAVKSRAAHAVAAIASEGSAKLAKVGEITREQLREMPTLAAVHGMVVDLERLSVTHPGGDLIRSVGGTECTGLFGSMHAFTAEANLVKLREYQVGTLKRCEGEIEFEMNSPFAVDLRAAIRQAMAGTSFYATMGWWVRCAFICVATLVCEFVWATTGNLAALVATGILHALIGICVQHDASHGAVSKNPTVNAFWSYGADWIGSSRWLWFQQHVVGHHPHCNLEGLDPDAHSAEPLLQFHWAPGVMRQWLLRYQWLYMYLVLPWYGPTVIYNWWQLATMSHADEVPISWWIKEKQLFAVMMRVFYYGRIVVAPVILAKVPWALAGLGVPLVTGFVLTFVFVVSHNFTGSDRSPAAKSKRVDFMRLQVETSCSYGGTLAMVLSGGLNMQIEHHCMPRLNSWHYPRIQEAVRSTCAKHQVQYVHFNSLWENVVSTISYMRFVGHHVTSSATTTTMVAVEDKAKVAPTFIVMQGKTLDVSRWAPLHPGGAEVFKSFAQRDAFEQFTAMHSPAATRQLQNMMSSAKLCKERAPIPQTALALEISKAHAQLRAEFEEEGLFEAPVGREVLRFAANMSFYVAGFCVMRFTNWLWTGAMLYAWGMQQSGWLSHDYLHHSVFKSVALNDFMGGFLGWMQGYDSEWWKNRHNQHHVTTNEDGFDPDIDLAPAFTYMNKHAKLNFVQRFQHIYFLPVVAQLHFMWLSSSVRHTVDRKMHLRTALLVLHHILMVTVVYRSGAGAFLWPHLLVGYVLKGFFTAVFVFSTHYPEVRLPMGAENMPLAQQTALTSRNIGGGWIVDWMSGGISKQIEHHLYVGVVSFVELSSSYFFFSLKQDSPCCRGRIWCRLCRASRPCLRGSDCSTQRPTLSTA